MRHVDLFCMINMDPGFLKTSFRFHFSQIELHTFRIINLGLMFWFFFLGIIIAGGH